MREISLFILIIGIIFITVGYMDNKIKEVKTEKEIVYKLIPMSIYEEQIKPSNIIDNFSEMFAKGDPSKSDYSVIN